MTIIEAIILGIIQGATEFLPISSSGHAFIIPSIFNLQEPNLAEVAIAHLGTLLAVIIYFFKDLWKIATDFFGGIAKKKPFETADSRLGWIILLGTIPAGVAGLLFEEPLDEKLGNPRTAAMFLLVTAAFLVLGEVMRSGKKKLTGLTWLDGLIIGIFQMFALFPGVSRSGSTIVGGLLRGLDRDVAARYSFLLGVPIIFAAGLFGLKDLFEADSFDVAPLVALFFTSAIVGYGCIHVLLQWLKKRSLYPFAVYCVLLSIVYLLFFQ